MGRQTNPRNFGAPSATLVAGGRERDYTPGVRPNEGDEIAGRYRLQRRIGAGGMGEVWVARHLELDLEMALKLIVPERAGSEKAERRFRREAQAAAKLKSPYIATIHDFGRSGGHLFLVMELLRGQDLATYLEAGPMGAGETLFVVEQLCRALAVTHEASIVHRDLKPSNIFLAEHGGERVTKLLDFGIAKTFGGSVSDADALTTETGARVGSPAYMSPEQIFGDGVTPQSDLWSLACVTYEMLAGVLPFYGAAPGRRYTEIVAGNVRPLELEDFDDATLMSFFRRCLSAIPEERLNTPADFCEGLREALKGQDPVMPARRLSEGAKPRPTVTVTLPGPASQKDASPETSAISASVDTGEKASTAHPTDPGERDTFFMVAGVPSPWRLRAAWLTASLVAGVIAGSFVLQSRSPTSAMKAQRMAPIPLPIEPMEVSTSAPPEREVAPPAATSASPPPEPVTPVPVRHPHRSPSPLPTTSVDPFSGLSVPVPR